jgi:hypothetical protein
MRQTEQFFVKGINQRFTKDRAVPERLAELKNARLFVRDETGFVSRVKGFENLLNDEGYSDVIAVTAIDGKHSTDTYRRGYKLNFTDRVTILEDGFFAEGGLIEDFFGVDDLFSLRIIDITELTPKETIELNTIFRKKIIRLKSFLDSVELFDEITIPRNFRLSFSESVDIKDYPLGWPE